MSKDGLKTGPFCEHMRPETGSASDLADDIARVACHQVYLVMRERMVNRKADNLAQSMRSDIRSAIWDLLTKGYVE